VKNHDDGWNKSMNDLSLTYSVADQSFAQTKSLGILNVSVQLLEALAERSDLRRLAVLSNPALSSRLQLRRQVSFSQHPVAVRSRIHRILWDQWTVYTAARKTGNDWLFLPKGFASFVRQCPVKLAVYVHDAVHAFYRQNFPRSVPMFEQQYFERCFHANLLWARLIVTNSDFSSKEVRRLAEERGIRPPRIVTVGMGFKPMPRRGAAKEERVVVLTTRWPHKRADLAIKFFAKWQEQTGYSGSVHWLGSLPEGVRLPEFANWHRSGRLADDEFHDLLSRARVLAYFSAYEGFGMPPVEAITAGTCPVYSALPATEEVMGDCGYSFSNESYDSFAAALKKALAEPPERMREWSEQLMRRHNWSRTTQKLMEALSICA
jgi:glycosyltransferase involved in cell wall biosynthesis